MVPTSGTPSISGRITRILAIVSVVGAALTTWLVAHVIHHEIDELLDHGLRESADLIHNVLARSPSFDLVSGVDTIAHEYEENLLWQVVDLRKGTVVARSKLAPPEPLHPRWESKLFDLDNDQADSHWRVLTLKMAQPEAHMLLVAQNHDERLEAQTEPLMLAGMASLLGALLTTALAYGLVRRELERLRELSRAVAEHDPLRPQSVLPVVDRREFQPIVDAVDSLGQRLAQRVVSERAFTAHAAHALRTPLAGLDVQLALAMRETTEPGVRERLQRTRGAATRLSRVVQALLAMFRTGIEPQAEWVPLGDLVNTSHFPELDLVVEGSDVWCDSDLFAAAFMNLLDNAQRHGAHTVRITGRSEGTDCVVRVSDDGHGCEAALIARMQDALDRQDYREGNGLTGLGLILADLVLRAHGGRVRLEPAAAAQTAAEPGALPRTGFALTLRWPLKT